MAEHTFGDLPEEAEREEIETGKIGLDEREEVLEYLELAGKELEGEHNG
jgi:hypothetical protein